MIKIVIGYGCELVLLGLKSLLQNSKFTVCGEAPMTDELLAQVSCHRPDILIIPLFSQEKSGLVMCNRVKQDFPQVKVVIFSALADEKAMGAALEDGASGYVLENVKGAMLLKILELIAKGNTFFDMSAGGHRGGQPTEERFAIEQMVPENGKQPGGQPQEINDPNNFVVKLTAMEQKIVALVAGGKTNKEIASILFISDKTVRNHLSRVLTKLRLANRTQVAQYYYSNLNNNV